MEIAEKKNEKKYFFRATLLESDPSDQCQCRKSFQFENSFYRRLSPKS